MIVGGRLVHEINGNRSKASTLVKLPSRPPILILMRFKMPEWIKWIVGICVVIAIISFYVWSHTPILPR